jgi:CRP-like cAMP-binding protein
MSDIDLREFLKGHHLCRTMTPGEIDVLLDFFERVNFDKGETIAEIGEVGEALYLVLQGEAGLLADDGHEEIEVGRMQQGELMGEMSFFDRQPRSVRMRALKPKTCLLKLTRPKYQRLRVEHPYVAVNLLEYAIISLDHLVRRQSTDVATYTRYIYGKGKK